MVLIFGIAGACRRDELVKMTVDDIEDKGSILIVRIPDSKTKRSRIFTITDDNSENSIHYISIYRKYIKLRPKTVNTPRRLFLKYNKGQCFNQVVGMNSIAKIPSEIAAYLKLPDCHLYTGHSFRRSSATLLVNGGGDMIQLKRHGGWKSSSAAEGYIEDDINNKIETTKKILPGSSTVLQSKNNQEFTVSSHTDNPTESGIIVKNCHNCTINFNIVNNK